MIEEVNGRWTCDKCGYEWSACISDDQVPEVCECEKDLTQEQKDSYVNGGSSTCPNPACKSEDITGGHIEVDSGGCYQPCHCSECHFEWNDIYKLVDVEIK